MSIADELLKMKSLLDAGLITEAEFNAQKNQMLGAVTPQLAQSESDETTNTVTSLQDTPGGVDDQQEKPASDSPAAATKEAPSPIERAAPPPPVGFAGRASPPTSGVEEVHDVESRTPDEELLELVASTTELPTNDCDDPQRGDGIEERTAVDEQPDLATKQFDVIRDVAAPEDIESVEGADSAESSLKDSPDEDEFQRDVDGESQSQLQTVEQPADDDQHTPLDDVIEDGSAALQQDIEDGVEPANDSELQPPEPAYETTPEDDDGEQDHTPSPPQPVGPQSAAEEVATEEKTQKPRSQRESRKLLMALVVVLAFAAAFVGGLLLNRPGQEIPATQSEQALASPPQPDETAGTTEPEIDTSPTTTAAAETTSAPTASPAPSATAAPTTTVAPETTSAPTASSAPSATAAPTTTVAPETTTAPTTSPTPATTAAPTTTARPPTVPTDAFESSLPWFVRSASGSDQGSRFVGQSFVGEWGRENCHSWTHDVTVSDPDGVVRVERLMIYVEGQVPTGTPDADCASQVYELVDGTEQLGTWRITFFMSPKIGCARYNDAIKITDSLGNTTVHTISGFFFGGSNPPSTCLAGEQYEAG